MWKRAKYCENTSNIINLFVNICWWMEWNMGNILIHPIKGIILVKYLLSTLVFSFTFCKNVPVENALRMPFIHLLIHHFSSEKPSLLYVKYIKFSDTFLWHTKNVRNYSCSNNLLYAANMFDQSDVMKVHFRISFCQCEFKWKKKTDPSPH